MVDNTGGPDSLSDADNANAVAGEKKATIYLWIVQGDETWSLKNTHG